MTVQDPPAAHLSVRQAAFIGVGAMVAAGIFSLLGAAGEVAGAASGSRSSSPGGRLLQGYSFAKFGARYPSAGGLLEYVVRGYGNGHVTGIIAWLLLARERHRDRHGRRVVRQLRERSGRRRQRRRGSRSSPSSSCSSMTVLNIVGSQAVAKVQTLVVFVVLGILPSSRSRRWPTSTSTSSPSRATRRCSDIVVERRADVLRVPRLRRRDVHRQGPRGSVAPAAPGDRTSRSASRPSSTSPSRSACSAR